MKPSYTKYTFSVVFLTLVVFFADQNVLGQLIEIENKIPKNVPIKVEFENQDSSDWAQELEIKVTNTGKKPIYFLLLFLIMKEEELDGFPVGYALRYGSDHLYSSGESLAQDEDSAILPNESHIFKIEKNTAEARKGKREKDGFSDDIQKATLKLALLNFGDGTGIMSNGVTFKKTLKVNFFRKRIPKCSFILRQKR